MPRPPRSLKVEQSRLITSMDEMFAALPLEEDQADTDWREPFVSLDEWLYSPRYMNLNIRLSELQLDFLGALDDYNPTTNRKTEFVAEWGKGGGKDFMCALAGLRCAYWLLCLEDCYDYYGMAKNTGIQIVNVAYTKDQAKNVFLKQVKGLLKGSPWFIRQKYREVRDRISFRSEIEFVSGAADGDSIEGQNMILAIMDEASAFRSAKVIDAVTRADGVKPEKAADEIYKVLRSSTRSRFMEVGKVAMISYPRYQGDFIQQKRKENENADEGYVSGPYCTWEVNPRVSEAVLKNSDDYLKRPEMAAAMYECKPPFSEDPYIGRPYKFIECVANTVKQMPDLVTPYNEDGGYELDFQGAPGRFHAIHVDLALRQDRCALALARQGEPVMVEKCTCNAFNFPDVAACGSCGRPYERWTRQLLPTMVVTLLKDFKPTSTGNEKKEVTFSDVRDEILWIRDRNHKIWSLSYDGWQSVDSIQTMNKILGARPVKDRWGKVVGDEPIARTLSVDKNTEAHDTLRDFIYTGRFFITPPNDVKKPEDWDSSMHPVAVAFREWRALRQVNAKKIDHPIGGSKDYIDALAGAAYWVAKMPISTAKIGRVRGWAEKSPKRHASTIYR